MTAETTTHTPVLSTAPLQDDDEASLGGEVVASSPGRTTAVRSSSAVGVK